MHSYALEVIQRLVDDHTVRRLASDLIGWRESDDPVADRRTIDTLRRRYRPVEPPEPDAELASDHPAEPDAHTGAGTPGNDPHAEAADASTGPPHRLRTTELLIAIRLAATFGSEDRLRACTAAGALTLLTGMEVEELRVILSIVGSGALAPELPIAVDPEHDRRGVALLLAPDGGIAPSRAAQDRYQRHIGAALELDAGVILATHDLGLLPDVLRSGQLDRLDLAPISRDVLIACLRHSHGVSGELDEVLLRSCLPDDHALARLPATALRLALRAPNSAAVAGRLAELIQTERSEVPDLDRMAGDGPALQAARRLIADLQLWQQGRVRWRDLSRSLLLYGPPGTGKTWLGRAMGNADRIALVEASFAQWQSAGHLGDMLREMRRSFAEAWRLAPSLLLIDEIDAVGSRSDDDRHGSNYRRQVVNGFLAEMDSLSRDEGVIMVGTCNDVTAIDPAVLRPGRFDLIQPMPLPDAAMLHGILDRHLRAEIDERELQDLATAAVGHSAAQLDAAIRAAKAAARHNGNPLDVAAIRRQLGIGADAAGQAAFDWRVAVHECGHAMICGVLGCGVIQRLVITPGGGETHRRASARQGVLADLEAEIAYNLAGRAAERLVFGDVAGGAGGPENSDLAQATRIAMSIETSLGLGLRGPVWTAAPADELLRDPALHARVRHRLEAAEASATSLLTTRRALLERMARALLRRRELTGPDVEAWLRPLDREEGNNPVGTTSSNEVPAC